MFKPYGRKSSFESETKTRTKIRMKNLGKELYFLTDGYFDFNDELWKSRGEVIRNLSYYFCILDIVVMFYS